MSDWRPSRTLVFGITAAGLLNNSILVSSTPEILRALDQPVEHAGLLVAAGALPGILVAPAVGFLADRFGRKRVLVPCLVAFGLFGLLAGLSPTMGWLLTARVAQGIGAAGLINLAVVLIFDHWQGLDRAAVIGQNSAVLTAALVIYPIIGGVTTEFLGWRWVFGLYAIPLAVAGFVGLTLEAGHPTAVGRARDQAREALVEVRRPSTATIILLGGLVFLVMFGLFLTVLPIHLDQKFGLGPAKRGLVAAIPALTSTTSALLVARVRAHVHAGWLVYWGLGVFAFAYVIMGVGSLWILVAATAVYGLAEGLTIPTMQDLVAADASDHVRGSVIAIWVGGVRIGQTIGPVGVTLALGFWSTGSVLVIAGMGLFGVTVIATGARTLVPRSKRETGEPL